MDKSFVERAGLRVVPKAGETRDTPANRSKQQLASAAEQIRTMWLRDLPDAPLGATTIIEADSEALTAAVARALRRLVGLSPKPRRKAHAPSSITVLSSWFVTDPALARSLIRDDSIHLPIVMDDDGVTLGPLVIPGVTACTWCVELARADRDPTWPELAPQLALATDRELPASLIEVAAGLAPSLLMLAAAGVTHGWRIERDVVATVRFDRHPECGCSGEFD